MSAYGGELFQSSFIDYEVKRRRRFIDQNEPEVFMRYKRKNQEGWRGYRGNGYGVNQHHQMANLLHNLIFTEGFIA
jgi:hypothetical protein